MMCGDASRADSVLDSGDSILAAPVGFCGSLVAPRALIFVGHRPLAPQEQISSGSPLLAQTFDHG